jgi:hypothetical protein
MIRWNANNRYLVRIKIKHRKKYIFNLTLACRRFLYLILPQCYILYISLLSIVPVRVSLTEVDVLQEYLYTTDFYLLRPSHYILMCVIAVMTWLTVAYIRCHRWSRICSLFVATIPSSFLLPCLITKCLTSVIRRLPLVEQKLPILPEYPTSCADF